MFFVDRWNLLAIALPRLDWLVWMAFLSGMLLIAASVTLFVRAGTTIEPFRPERSKHLVTDGVHRLSRNPMYLGMLLWLLAWSLWLGNLLTLLGLVFFVGYLNRFQIKPEERILADLFGRDYQEYSQRVRRWL